jgi:hypothetical protein
MRLARDASLAIRHETLLPSETATGNHAQQGKFAGKLGHVVSHARIFRAAQ